MAKKAKKRDQSRDEKLERKLNDAESRLAEAQAKRADVKRKGEEAVQRARARAENRLHIATANVEKRAAQLSALQDRRRAGRISTNAAGNGATIRPAQLSPDAVAAELQDLRQEDEGAQGVIVVPEAPNARMEEQLDAVHAVEADLDS